MTARLSLMLMLFTAAPAFALAPPPAAAAAEDCIYSGQIVLDADEQIYCRGNIRVEAGTRIITRDNFVQFITPKTITFGTNEVGVSIECTGEREPAADGDAECGNVQIDALTLDGALNVKAKAEGRRAGRIDFVIGSYALTYRHNLDTDQGKLQVTRAGRDRTADDVAVRWASR